MEDRTDIGNARLDGFIDLSDHRSIGPAEFEELVKAQTDEEVFIAPVWSDVVDVYFEDEMDLCPFCGTHKGCSQSTQRWLTWCV